VEWLLLLLVPVALLMLAVGFLPLGYMPDVVRRFRGDWRASGRAQRTIIVVLLLLGPALFLVVEVVGVGRWVAYALLAFMAVPVVYGALLPLLLFVQHRRSRQRST